jgi:ubiquinone/menaquinone biosynthesis C-methylase UbiE
MSPMPHPEHLGRDHAVRFRDQSIVDAYHFRPTYPEETFDLLVNLLVDEPHAVLDVGCGRGDIARRLVERVERIDAVDFSLPMIEKGKELPNGNHPHLRWIYGPAEEAPLDPPYALITAGQSIHWMDWDAVMPRFRAALTPHGSVAVVTVEGSLPWDSEIAPIIRRYSTNQRYQPVDLIAEWQARKLFEVRGKQATAPVYFAQPLDAYIESFHGRSSLSRDHMSKEAAAAFDAEMRAVVHKYLTDEIVGGEIYGTIFWGRPI